MIEDKSDIVAVVLALLWISTLLTHVYLGYAIDRDIGSNIERAGMASDAEDMQGYLHDAQDGMQKWGYTDGHYAILFKKPYNDAGHDYKATERMIERLEKVKTMDKGSTEYQVAMDDIRGTVRDHEFRPYRHYVIHNLWALASLIYAAIGWKLAAVAWLIKFDEFTVES